MSHRLTAADSRWDDLLRRLYRAGSIDLRRSEVIYRTAKERPPTWALDMRRPLLRSRFLRPTAEALCDIVTAHGVDQVAGAGMGAAPLVAGIVALGRGVDGAMVRDHPKRRGLVRPLEGELDPERPVWIVDDVVNTGGSSLRLARTLEEAGCRPTCVLCLFRYAWGRGGARLAARGLELRPLATLERRRAWRHDSARRMMRRLVPDLP